MLCERCMNDHDGSYGSGRFCASKCARGFSTAEKRSDINTKVSKKLQRQFVDSSDDLAFTQALREASSWRCLGRILGFQTTGGNLQKHLRNRAADLKLDASHFKKPRSLDERLCNQPRGSKPKLRSDLIAVGRKYECEECKIGPEWNGKKLTIQVDHINGDNKDHRESNLRFLCPNCHSQTSTFTWKNTKIRRERRSVSA